MDENKDAEQDMEDVLQDSAEIEESNDKSTDKVEQKGEQEADNGEEEHQDSTGSKRLDKAIEKKPDINLDRILDRMRSRTDYDEPPKYNADQREQYKPIQYQDGEYTPDQLDQDRKAYAELQRQNGVNQGANQAFSQYKLDRFADNLELDKERVTINHPELDENSDEFQPARASRMNRMYYNYIGYDEKKGTIARTDVRYKDFIDGMMALADDIATSRSSETVKNVARQASRTGVRPNGGRTTGPSLNSVDSLAKMSREDFAKNRDKVNEIALQMLANEQ
jgi:hypothetical protein